MDDDRHGVRLPVTVTVQWWPLRLRLHTDDRHIARWFRHHLHTAAAVREPEPIRTVTVEAFVDATLTDRVTHAVSGGRHHPVEGYIGERWTAGWYGGRRAWCHGFPPDEAAGRHVIVHVDDDRWLSTGADSRHVATATVRFVRELIRTELARCGAVTMHSSLAITPGGDGVLFVGGSGAGKTTLALAAARAGGYLVSGDQCELLAGPAGGVWGVGFPWVFRLGAGTLAGLGADRSVAGTTLARPQPSIVDGRIAAGAYRFGSLDKIELTMLEIDSLLDAGCLDIGPVHAVVVLAPDGVGDRPVVEPVDLAEAAGTLRREYREPDPTFASFWLAAPERQPQARPFEGLRHLLGAVPVLRMSWRPDRHDPGQAVAAVRLAQASGVAS